MTFDRWVTLIILSGGAFIQIALAVDAWVHRRASVEQDSGSRLEALERDFDKIRAKASADAGRWQEFIGRIEIRLAVVEERQRMRTRKLDLEGD